MPVVQVIWVEGKGEDVKRAVAEEIVASIARHTKVQPKFIHVAFDDIVEPEPLKFQPYIHKHGSVKRQVSE